MEAALRPRSKGQMDGLVIYLPTTGVLRLGLHTHQPPGHISNDTGRRQPPWFIFSYQCVLRKKLYSLLILLNFCCLSSLPLSLSLSQAGLWLEFGEKGRCIVPILNRKTVSIKNLGPQQSLWVVSAGATWTCLGPIKGLTRRPSEIPAKELRRWIRKCLRAEDLSLDLQHWDKKLGVSTLYL